MSAVIRMAALGVLTLLTSCAWTNRANRPVWNAFESNLVPGSQTAFVCTLPLTVPAGLLVIVGDTLIAHPIQVVDDALGDAGDVWDSLSLTDAHYYTNAAEVPFRAVWTPVVFAGSFLGRSMFDIRPHDEREVDEQTATRNRDAKRTKEVTDQRARVLAWLRTIAEGGEVGDVPGPITIDDEARAAIERALTSRSALGRRAVNQWAMFWARGAVDWSRALGDESAVVRFGVLEDLRPDVMIPAAVQQRLLADPDATVRELAAQRFR